MLRFLAPSQYQGRFTLTDVKLHGQVIPAQQRVILLTGAACRDEREFPDPDRFDVLRRPERSLYFGLGHHVCLGKSLARQEGRIAFEELLKRFPRYRVVPESLRRTTSGNTQGLASVDVMPGGA
jgi:cytochrome P450